MSDPTHAHAAPRHRDYVRIWALLVVLLVVSVAGPMLGIPLVTLIAAFGIALVKAYLVAKNFMHLDVEKPIVHAALGLTLLIMVVLYAGVAPDVQKSAGQNWKKSDGFHHVSEAAKGDTGQPGHDERARGH
jgi:caa(3)-type oxidase subunit IV